MAQTIKQKENEIIGRLLSIYPDLSTSDVAEWRLWAHEMAVSIHSFELSHDIFRHEVDELTDRVTPGTEQWYAQMCRRFQNGHELLFDQKTAMLYYAQDDPDARIVKVVVITVGVNQIALKVAKFDQAGKIIPLSVEELYNFTGYAQSFKFADDLITVVSTTADTICYNMEVFYKPSIPVTIIKEKVEQALSDFRLKLDFDAMFYPQRMIDAVMSVEGIVTVNLRTISRRGATETGFSPIEVMAELQSGYFEYDKENTLTLTSIKA